MKICPVCNRRYPDNALHCPEDGAVLQIMTQPPEEESILGRRLFGEYSVVTKLGEGGMGAVYLLRQDQIDQHIAVKVLHGRAAQNDELVQRFNREAKAVSMLSHPNIINVFIFGRTDDGLIYMAMEYVEGSTLRDVFENEGAIEELRAIKIMKQCLSALSEAHSFGIIHRDMKPDNILLKTYRGEPDFVKVLDFGIAKVKEPSGVPQQKLTQAGVVYGTPEYLSPEQAQAVELDHRSDLYSLGVIFYEMITGRVPFDAPTAVTILTMHVFEEPPRPSEVAPNPVSPETERIILKAMSKKPANRYATAMEFLEDLSKREAQIMAETGRSARVSLPGDVLVSGTFSQLDPGDNGKTVAMDQPNIPAPAPPPQVTPAPASDGTMRKVLIAIIAVSVLLLIGVVVAIGTLVMMKGG